MADKNETFADIRKDAEAKFRELVEAHMQRRSAFQTTVGAMQAFNNVFDRLEAARKREVEKLNSAIQATVSRSDAEIDRLRREIAELKRAGNVANLPDGWKMYDKYKIRHTDGTPLKGKRYFVLRLDSDDPLEAARVAAAMSAYKGETQQGDVAKLREAAARAMSCSRKTISSVADGEYGRKTARGFKWAYANPAQMPYEEGGAK